jgi:hypothetical protein
VGIPHAKYMTENNLCLEEYIELRRKAAENLYLATQLGRFEDRLFNFEGKLLDLERMVRDGK